MGSCRYCLEVIWPFLSTGNQEKCEAKLRQALRIIVGLPLYAPNDVCLYLAVIL